MLRMKGLVFYEVKKFICLGVCLNLSRLVIQAFLQMRLSPIKMVPNVVTANKIDKFQHIIAGFLTSMMHQIHMFEYSLVVNTCVYPLFPQNQFLPN